MTHWDTVAAANDRLSDSEKMSGEGVVHFDPSTAPGVMSIFLEVMMEREEASYAPEASE